MTFFLLKNKENEVQLVSGDFALPYMKDLLKDYKEWLKEAKTRKRFSTDTEARAAKGGTKGFVWYLLLTDEGIETYPHEYLDELDIDTGKSESITSNPSLA